MPKDTLRLLLFEQLGTHTLRRDALKIEFEQAKTDDDLAAQVEIACLVRCESAAIETLHDIWLRLVAHPFICATCGDPVEWVEFPDATNCRRCRIWHRVLRLFGLGRKRPEPPKPTHPQKRL